MSRVILGFSFILLFMFAGCRSEEGANANSGTGGSSPSMMNSGGALEKGPTVITGLETYEDGTSIGECGGLFATGEQELNEGSFIFTSDLESFGLIQADGQMVRLRQVGQKFLSGSSRFYKYESNGITVDLEIREVRDLNEKVTLFKGQLKVNSGDFIDVIQVMGKVGCS